ncbi:hypothetical protein B0H65DRAFT_549196 [Neurospora tetraspora]|uniref:Ecp2 effector protein domain-containing protein n=1 Tax=Neurospora tetraspora TaxID=94610 RepID=A0AAE0MTD4_9PEZI|nr:hypothetical protein B0H65DRAFT_549196 [Neurospora tetraspora]
MTRLPLTTTHALLAFLSLPSLTTATSLIFLYNTPNCNTTSINTAMIIQAGTSCRPQTNGSASIGWTLDTPCAAVIFYNETGCANANVQKAVVAGTGGFEMNPHVLRPAASNE